MQLARWVVGAALSLAVTGAGLAAAEIDGALSAAIRAGQIDQVRQLLANGSDPNGRERAYVDAPALTLAVHARNAPLVALLLAAGAKPDALDRRGQSALYWAAYYGDSAIVSQLLDQRDKPALADALAVAMRRGHQRVIGQLIGALGLRKPLTREQSAMVEAIERGDGATVEALLAVGVAPDARDADASALLTLAARLGRADIAHILIEAGAKVDPIDRIGFTPLFEACREGKLATVEYLLDRGAQVNRRALPSGMALTPLHVAAAAGHLDVVLVLLQRGASIDLQDSERNTALHLAMQASDPVAVLLLDSGANPDLQNSQGASARSAMILRLNDRLQAALARHDAGKTGKK